MIFIFDKKRWRGNISLPDPADLDQRKETKKEKIESMKRGFFDQVVCEYSAEID